MNAHYRATIRRYIQANRTVSFAFSILYSRLLGLLAWRFRISNLFHCHIALSARITGWSSCQFGRNIVISSRTWLNVNMRDNLEARLVIGDNTFIGQDNFFTVGESIHIGAYCLTAAKCAFIGSSHIVNDPMLPYLVTGTTNQDTIFVGTNCFFGYGAMVLGNVHIGHGSIVGAGAVVRTDVPPFSVVVGNPAKVIRYYDFEEAIWKNGSRPAESAPVIDEETYLACLIAGHPYPIQPLSAAVTVLGDI